MSGRTTTSSPPAVARSYCNENPDTPGPLAMNMITACHGNPSTFESSPGSSSVQGSGSEQPLGLMPHIPNWNQPVADSVERHRRLGELERVQVLRQSHAQQQAQLQGRIQPQMIPDNFSLNYLPIGFGIPPDLHARNFRFNQFMPQALDADHHHHPPEATDALMNLSQQPPMSHTPRTGHDIQNSHQAAALSSVPGGAPGQEIMIPPSVFGMGGPHMAFPGYPTDQIGAMSFLDDIMVANSLHRTGAQVPITPPLTAAPDQLSQNCMAENISVGGHQSLALAATSSGDDAISASSVGPIGLDVAGDHNALEAASSSGGDGQLSPGMDAFNTDRPKAARAQKKNNVCHICNKGYARPSTLKTHMRTHTKHRPYPCKVCDKRFTQAANLNAHMRTHTGAKPFSCKFCKRNFSQSSSVTTHERTHNGERPFRCNTCGKSFADTSTLTKHQRTHTGAKPYICKVCNAAFSQSGNLNRHMNTHRNK